MDNYPIQRCRMPAMSGREFGRLVGVLQAYVGRPGPADVRLVRRAVRFARHQPLIGPVH